MTDVVMSRGVDRITILKTDDQGRTFADTVYAKGAGKKKQSKALQPLERMFRRVATAQANAAITYLDRHHRSNRKKRNGWIRDMGQNVMRAQRKGLRKYKRLVVALPSAK